MGRFRDWATCLDCGERRMVGKRLWIRASQPRCMRCGGTLEQSSTAADEKAEQYQIVKEKISIIEVKMNKTKPQ